MMEKCFQFFFIKIYGTFFEQLNELTYYVYLINAEFKKFHKK